MPNLIGLSRGSGLTVWGSVHPFALPDKMGLPPLMYHLQAAGFTGVVYPVPPVIYWPDPEQSPDLGDLPLWITAARSHGLAVILDVGPTFDVGLPWQGVPPAWWRADPEEREERLARWWQAIRLHLPRDGVVFRRRCALLAEDKIAALAEHAWRGYNAWAVDDWPVLDVRDFDHWAEWAEDTAWWARVDALDPSQPVRVRFWWAAAEAQAAWPDPDAVHEEVGPHFIPTLLTSLWARGVRWIWWEPVRGGLVWGIDPPWEWSPVLDGGAALRAWGMPTATWRALRRTLQHGHALRVGQFTWEPWEESGDAAGSWLAYGFNFWGELWAFRTLSEGEVTVPPPQAERPLVRATGPTGFLVPRALQVLDGKGRLRLVLMPVIYHEHRPLRDTWVVDCHEGGDVWLDLPGEVAYETGVHLEQEGPRSWHVRFDAGKPGQVLWQVGEEQFHLVGVDRYGAERAWPRGLAGKFPFMWGPSQLISAEPKAAWQWELQVTTDAPTALMVADEHPWRLQVKESGRRSVWGARSGVGGVALGGPKEWGAPRVLLPELAWQSRPWAGPLTLEGWERWAERFPVALDPGWHWFRTRIPPEWREIRITLQGVADIWLGGQRVGGVRSLDARRERRLALPPREDEEPLTFLIWVPPSGSEATLTGWFDVLLPGATTEPWEYRGGLPGLEVRWPFWRWVGDRHPPAELPPAEAAAIWCHEAEAYISTPNTAWVYLGLTLGDLGELAWVFVNGVLVTRWWAGWMREPALWIPPDLLSFHGWNRFVLLHWPRGRPIDLAQVQLVQLGRERVHTVVAEKTPQSA